MLRSPSRLAGGIPGASRDPLSPGAELRNSDHWTVIVFSTFQVPSFLDR
jgi:hypothetical protein